MPVFVSSFIFISARGGAYHDSGWAGSFSSNSQRKSARRFTCSLGTAFLITIYPFSIQNFQSSSDRIVRGLLLLRSLSFTLLVFDVEGLPGISLWAFLGAIVGVIVCCIRQVLNDLITQRSFCGRSFPAPTMTNICSPLTFLGCFL